MPHSMPSTAGFIANEAPNIINLPLFDCLDICLSIQGPEHLSPAKQYHKLHQNTAHQTLL